MKIVITNITNNANTQSAAIGLEQAQLLAAYYTTLAVFPGNQLDILSRIKGLSAIQRRRFNPVLEPYVKMCPWREIGRLIATKAGLSSLIRFENDIFNINSITRNLDMYVAKNIKVAFEKGSIGVYSCEDTAVHSFREAKKFGMLCLYDLPIGYWREAHRILEHERQSLPEWAGTLTGLSDSQKKLAQKDEELQLADEIFVASSFTANSLKAYPGKLAPVHVIPYGYPPVFEGKRNYPSKDDPRPLKLLFVGGLSQRKGIAYLFEAVKALGNRVQLTVVGHKPLENCAVLDDVLTKHRWIPTLPHHKVLELMRQNDVLVFPSLFEGFGLVITEAMSQGTPVITTERTAGPDIITHGKDGWLVKAGSTEALKTQIEELLIQPQKIEEVGKAAKESARNWAWKNYGDQLASTIEKII